jgi:hypothetical protein
LLAVSDAPPEDPRDALIREQAAQLEARAAALHAPGTAAGRGDRGAGGPRFPALEAPADLAADLQAFFAPLS